MTSRENDLRKVRALIRIYGTEPGRWPEGERHLASMLADPSLSAAIGEERGLDNVLSESETPQPSQALYTKVLAIPAGSAGVRGGFTFGLWPFRAAWQPASVAVLALVMGIAAGQITQVQIPADQAASTDLDEVMMLAMSDLALGELPTVYFDTEIPQ